MSSRDHRLKGQHDDVLACTLVTVHAGRNQLCPCGSGKKYKKCCLPKDEAEDRETMLTPERLEAKDGDGEWLNGLEEEGDDLPEDDGWGLELDVETVTRVCYTHGMVQTVADL